MVDLDQGLVGPLDILGLGLAGNAQRFSARRSCSCSGLMALGRPAVCDCRWRKRAKTPNGSPKAIGRAEARGGLARACGCRRHMAVWRRSNALIRAPCRRRIAAYLVRCSRQHRGTLRHAGRLSNASSPACHSSRDMLDGRAWSSRRGIRSGRLHMSRRRHLAGLPVHRLSRQTCSTRRFEAASTASLCERSIEPSPVRRYRRRKAAACRSPAIPRRRASHAHQRAVRGRAGAERLAYLRTHGLQFEKATAAGGGATTQFDEEFSANRRVVITVTP